MTVHRSENGFTLLEVMVALSIIATVLVTMLGTHLLSLNLSYKHREQTMLAILARQKMQEIFTLPFDEVASDSGDFGPNHPEYEWELDVENADIDNLKKVRILVTTADSEFELMTELANTSTE
ncbi:MAG: type II secretion system protein GspI [Candidatus Abyssobacteria bacterium SURF_17]|jgi:general secretion pathway protein I|uniref:Type II secretion system protein I n=1 Tax=Candidatus Abyssobacteria bacterium SURF_17 TaxID=2093361 RepID=A0A419EMV3_9BACT|nr:MAG: type II secretion system protein GspI [Candidatus Abyssubacteria bacterium SURF_17]